MAPTTLELASATTHPWIDFRFDMNQLGYKTWLLLGEIESKCSHLAGSILRPEVAQELHAVNLTKGIHGTTSIEGNTLSEDEVRARIDGELDLPPSREYLGREIDNILDITNELAQELIDGVDASLSVERILHFNEKILDGLPLMPEVVPGKTRSHSVTVGISSYRGAPAGDCEELLTRMVDWLNGLRAPDDHPQLRFPIAVCKAVLAHLYIAWIHPFGDGNGRTARMIEFQLMIDAGAPSPAAHLLSNHYNETRQAYLVELDKTSRLPGFPIEHFLNYALQGLVDQLRDQIETVRSYQYRIMWEHYVHDLYRNDETPAKRRQRHLVLDMQMGKRYTRSELRTVSDRIRFEYEGKGPKTLTRDLRELEARRLIRRAGDQFILNHRIIQAFRPLAREITSE